mmetsp:Transcript_95398/g.270030  ORF Transcript_95398/g.270030 Transcript_95398/m.270030 type:complete len:357 (+) Transcript_95398:1855-2925(+)
MSSTSWIGSGAEVRTGLAEHEALRGTAAGPSAPMASRCSVSDRRTELRGFLWAGSSAAPGPRLGGTWASHAPRGSVWLWQSRYVVTFPLPFISISPRGLVSTQSGSSVFVSSPNWTSPGRPFCIIRAAVLIVSPKRRKRGSFCPMTPATTGPVWIPILSMTSSLLSASAQGLVPWPDWSAKISLAARMRRPRIPWWPCSMSSLSSSGTTPTAQTYSSPTVSIFVTPCRAQMLSKCVKCLLRNARRSPAESLRAVWSKSTSMMKRTDTRFTWSAITPPGFFSIGTMTCSGTMYSRMWYIFSLASRSFTSYTNLVLWPLCRYSFLTMAMKLAAKMSTMLDILVNMLWLLPCITTAAPQ